MPDDNDRPMTVHITVSLSPDVALDMSRGLEWVIVSACKAERDGKRCTRPDDGHTRCHLAGRDYITMWDDDQ